MHLRALAGSSRGSELFGGPQSHYGRVPWSLVGFILEVLFPPTGLHVLP